MSVPNNKTESGKDNEYNKKKRRSSELKDPVDDEPDDDVASTDDPIKDESKLVSRREANRLHALKSRQRSKQLLQELQQTIQQYNYEKMEYERQNAILTAQVDVLRQQNAALLQSQQQYSNSTGANNNNNNNNDNNKMNPNTNCNTSNNKNEPFNSQQQQQQQQHYQAPQFMSLSSNTANIPIHLQPASTNAAVPFWMTQSQLHTQGSIQNTQQPHQQLSSMNPNMLASLMNQVMTNNGGASAIMSNPLFLGLLFQAATTVAQPQQQQQQQQQAMAVGAGSSVDQTLPTSPFPLLSQQQQQVGNVPTSTLYQPTQLSSTSTTLQQQQPSNTNVGFSSSGITEASNQQTHLQNSGNFNGPIETMQQQQQLQLLQQLLLQQQHSQPQQLVGTTASEKQRVPAVQVPTKSTNGSGQEQPLLPTVPAGLTTLQQAFQQALEDTAKTNINLPKGHTTDVASKTTTTAEMVPECTYNIAESQHYAV